MDELTLSPVQAYAAMQRCLERYYELTGSDDVGGLLGGMSILPDGGTADPAEWSEWLDVVRQVLAEDQTDPRGRLRFD